MKKMLLILIAILGIGLMGCEKQDDSFIQYLKWQECVEENYHPKRFVIEDWMSEGDIQRISVETDVYNNNALAKQKRDCAESIGIPQEVYEMYE